MSELFHIGYPGNPCNLPLLNLVGITLEFTALHSPLSPRTSCWGSFCKCGTYSHGIWGSKCTPNTPAGRWTNLLPFLWPLRPHSYARPQSPSWYSPSKSGWEMMGISDPTSEKYFWLNDILLLRPWILLQISPLGPHKPLLQAPMHIPRVILQP